MTGADVRRVVQIPILHRRERSSLTISEVLNRRTDLSTFVVHLTRDSETGTARDNLVSIIEERRLRAGDSKGWATWDGFGLNEDALATQRVVCFSETPLEHVHSLFAEIDGRALQFRSFGVAFPKMVARWMEVNPVWYVDLSRAPGMWRDWPIKDALNALVVAARDGNDFGAHPVARLTPFIEGMGSFPNGNGGVRQREFSWEREWRHVGDLDLAPWWSKALWLCPESELDHFQRLVGDGGYCIDPAWGLERIVGHLMGMAGEDMTPFAAH
jgi:hypothetical protein